MTQRNQQIDYITTDTTCTQITQIGYCIISPSAYSIPEKPSLEVALTTLRSALLIYSFQFRSVFDYLVGTAFHEFTFTFSLKRNFFIL